MPALYAPLIAMLLALIFRGVAFEYRWKTARGQFLWDWAFAGGSTLAAFAQGVALGALVNGIAVTNDAYAGGAWDWLTPFSLATGLALVLGYALLGATWLIYKSEDALQAMAFRFAEVAAIGTLAGIVIVSAWTPLLHADYFTRWIAWPQIAYTAPVPILVAVLALVLFRALRAKAEGLPFLASLGLFVLSYIGIAISFYPYIVPNSVTIWQAAAPDNSLAFLLAGASVLLPMILAYTAYSYWTFRGKVNAHPGGYHA
jgi:cytochrome d ubiquinol oxidase subunit II